ncbi:MAG: FAD binding domain-containing protein [Planctomycetota bacterium]|nr:FAD binding domain-containing protein [Planctomycetota bacterium]
MKAFKFLRARTCGEAAQLLAKNADARVHAGGTDLLGRMKERLDTSDVLVSLCDAAGLDQIRVETDGSIWIGARVTLAELAASEACRTFLPTLAEAAGLAASPQLRQRATIAGNLAQQTRCHYFRLATFPCWKRGDDACPVKEAGGVQDTAGIFDGACVSAHPSSVAPVLGSLDAEITVRDAKGPRPVPFDAFWAAPKPGIATDTILGAGDVIEAIRIPPRAAKQYMGYAEVRQKAAFDWALVSCAVRYEIVEGAMHDVRVWFGSVAPAPWRARLAEAALQGGACTDEAAAKAADAALAEARPVAGAAYKEHLARVALRRALADAREGAK